MQRSLEWLAYYITIYFIWLADIRDGSERKATAKLLKYLRCIQEQYQKNLDEQIDQEILSDVAKHLHNWDTKCDLLELDYKEVRVIKEESSSFLSQRYYYSS